MILLVLILLWLKSLHYFYSIFVQYILTPNSKEVIVYCPESRNATATQHPFRRSLDTGLDSNKQATKRRNQTRPLDEPTLTKSAEPQPEPILPQEIDLKENHFTIFYGDTGYSYESIFVPYFAGAKSIEIEDPYIRMNHQIQNFVRFCETVVKHPNIKNIDLITSYDDDIQKMEIEEKLGQLQQSLLEMDVMLNYDFNPNIHDREIRIDNGWVIKIGRGLDFYQKPQTWNDIGATDLSLRKCLETKVDIFKSN